MQYTFKELDVDDLDKVKYTLQSYCVPYDVKSSLYNDYFDVIIDLNKDETMTLSTGELVSPLSFIIGKVYEKLDNKNPLQSQIDKLEYDFNLPACEPKFYKSFTEIVNKINEEIPKNEIKEKPKKDSLLDKINGLIDRFVPKSIIEQGDESKVRGLLKATGIEDSLQSKIDELLPSSKDILDDLSERYNLFQGLRDLTGEHEVSYDQLPTDVQKALKTQFPEKLLRSNKCFITVCGSTLKIYIQKP